MKALIDGDIVAYRCAGSCEPSKKKAGELKIPLEELEREPCEVAIHRVDELVYRILSDCQTEDYRIFISGDENFRKKLYPEYKANRSNLVRPLWLDRCREFLIEEWGGEICAGYEADDGIGMSATGDFIICSIDKDFGQIAGKHYNFVRNEFENISSHEAAFRFWSSILTGDRSDNIRGIDGIGPVKSRKLLYHLSPEQMESTCREFYRGRESEYILNYTLLRILRSKEELKEIEAKIMQIEREESSKTGSETNL